MMNIVKVFAIFALLSIASCAQEKKEAPSSQEKQTSSVDISLDEARMELTPSMPEDGPKKSGQGDTPIQTALIQCLNESIEARCERLKESVGPVCKEGMKIVGCYAKSGYFGANFCSDACKSQSRFRRPVCMAACNSYLNDSPGPYSTIAQGFIDGACREQSNPVKDQITQICSSLKISTRVDPNEKK